MIARKTAEKILDLIEGGGVGILTQLGFVEGPDKTGFFIKTEQGYFRIDVTPLGPEYQKVQGEDNSPVRYTGII